MFGEPKRRYCISEVYPEASVREKLYESDNFIIGFLPGSSLISIFAKVEFEQSHHRGGCEVWHGLHKIDMYATYPPIVLDLIKELIEKVKE